MKNIAVTIIAILGIIQLFGCSSQTDSCSIENEAYHKLLLEMDNVFYSDEIISDFSKLIEVGELSGFYSEDFITLVNKVKALYVSKITDKIIDSIWSKAPSFYYMNNKKYNITELRVKQSRFFIELLSQTSTSEKGLIEYKNYLLEFGTIPTNIDATKLVYNIGKSDCTNRLIIYIHFITWLSHYP